MKCVLLLFALLVFALFLAGCVAPEQPQPPQTIGSISLQTTKPYFINGETVQLKLQNDSEKPIYFLRGIGRTIGPCGVANAVVFKMTNKFEPVFDYNHKQIACRPALQYEKLGPSQEALLEWPYPQIFRENGEELPLLGEYKIAITYSENENGSNPIETQSNEFLISKGLFVQFNWSTGKTKETLTKLEDRIVLERESLETPTKFQKQSFSLSSITEQEYKTLEDSFIGAGLTQLQQKDLNEQPFAKNWPEKNLKVRYNDLQARLQWKDLEQEPYALAVAVNKLNELRKRFDGIAPTENEWLSYSPLQCNNNPWEKWHNDLNRQYIRVPTEEEILTEYLQTVLDVNIVDYRRLPAMPGTVICQACNCARGDSIQVLVNKTNANALQNTGWKKEFKIGSNGEFCASDQQCPTGYVCHISQYCSPNPDGIQCEPQEGDSRCHKKCANNIDCIGTGDTTICATITRYHRDTTIRATNMCIAWVGD